MLWKIIYHDDITMTHNGHDGVSNHQPHGCLLKRIFSRWPVNSPLKWPVTRKMFPFDDVIMDDRHWSGPRPPRNEEAFWVQHKIVDLKRSTLWYLRKNNQGTNQGTNQPTNQPTNQTHKSQKQVGVQRSFRIFYQVHKVIPSRNNMAAALH